MNECSTNNGGCSTNGKCTNTIGSFSCSCNSGYEGNGVNCEDVDECSRNTDNCADDTATCTNTIGSYTCACDSGYSGDGVSCTGNLTSFFFFSFFFSFFLFLLSLKLFPFYKNIDVDECTLNTDNCAEDIATCTNTIGSFTCACKTGYSGNGVVCDGNLLIN